VGVQADKARTPAKAAAGDKVGQENFSMTEMVTGAAPAGWLAIPLPFYDIQCNKKSADLSAAGKNFQGMVLR
jgi:hypothetical protein